MQNAILSPTIYGLASAPEFRETRWLARLIEQGGLPASAGTVSLHPNIFFQGAKHAQIDILLQAHFTEPFTRPVLLPYTTQPTEVAFRDVLATIDVKRHAHPETHPEPSVRLTPNKAQVRYRDKITGQYTWRDALQDSIEQARSAKEFVRFHTGWEPYVCNLLLFSKLRKADLPPGPNVYLASDSTFDDLLEKLCVSSRFAHFSRIGSVPVLSCDMLQDSASAAEHYTRLQQLLGAHKYVPTTVTPMQRPAVVPAPIVQAQHLPASPAPPSEQPIDKVGHFSRTSKKAPRWAVLFLCIFFLAIPAVLAFAIYVAYSALGARFVRHHAPAVHSELRTCASTSPANICDARDIFKPGATVYVQFLSPSGDRRSAILRNPRGGLASLTPVPPGSGSMDEFVIHLPANRKAAQGIYTVSGIGSDANGSAPTKITHDFIVSR